MPIDIRNYKSSDESYNEAFESGVKWGARRERRRIRRAQATVLTQLRAAELRGAEREREACARRAVERAHDLGIPADKQQSIAAVIRAAARHDP